MGLPAVQDPAQTWNGGGTPSGTFVFGSTSGGTPKTIKAHLGGTVPTSILDTNSSNVWVQKVQVINALFGSTETAWVCQSCFPDGGSTVTVTGTGNQDVIIGGAEDPASSSVSATGSFQNSGSTGIETINLTGVGATDIVMQMYYIFGGTAATGTIGGVTAARMGSPQALSDIDVQHRQVSSGGTVACLSASGNTTAWGMSIAVALAQPGGGGGGIGPVVGEPIMLRAAVAPRRAAAPVDVFPRLAVPKAWHADPDYRRQMPSARTSIPIDVLPKLAVPKAWPVDSVPSTAGARPSRAAALDMPLPALPVVSLSKWSGDTSTVRAQPTPRRAANDALLPAIAAASALATIVDGAAPTRSARAVQAQPGDQVFPSLGVKWAPDVLFARAMPAAVRVLGDAPFPAVSVLPTWAAEGPQNRAAAAPLRIATDTALPAVMVLPIWAAEGPANRSTPSPARAFQDVQLPAPRVLLTWVADGTTQLSAPAPKRSQPDPAPPALASQAALSWAPDAQGSRAQLPLQRTPQDGPLPALRAPSPWAAEGPPAQGQRSPARQLFETALPPPFALQLQAWPGEGNAPRALRGLLRFTPEVPLPAVLANQLAKWAPDQPSARAQPGPLRYAQDVQLPANRVLPTWAAEGPPNRTTAPPQRQTLDQAVIVASVVRFVPDSPDVRPAVRPMRVPLDAAVFASTLAPYVGDVASPRIAARPPARAPADAVLPAIGLVPWVAHWQYQRTSAPVQRAVVVSFELAPLVTVGAPGCAHGTVTALYSATGAMFLTASASGTIGLTASATGKVKNC